MPPLKKIDSTITYGDENNKKHEQGFAVFQGKGVRLDGKDKPASNIPNSKIKEDNEVF